MAASRFLSPFLVVQTDELSMPTLASSAAGLTMTGRVRSAGILLPWARVNLGMGTPLRESSVLATCLRWHDATAQGRHPV